MAEQAIEWHETGAGTPLVILPGWGQGPGVVEPLARALARDHRVRVAALPGIAGSRPDVCGPDVGAIADAVARHQQAPAIFVGWSLGGLVALAAAARLPERVTRLVLLAATPRFTAAPGWPGMDPALFDRFAEAVEHDPVATRERFLGLQLAPGAGQRDVLRRLRRIVRDEPAPAVAALRDGLALLRHSDLRATAATLACPFDAILARHDPLVPVAVAPHLRTLGARTHILADLGHAPFLTAPERVATHLAEIELERSTSP